jgi:hypothetical protein
MKELRRFFCFLLLFLLLERPCHYATHGFNIHRVLADLPYAEEFAVNTPIPKDLLAMPYSLLGSGAQIYAFESADKTHVIKLFKFQHLLPSPLAKLTMNKQRRARKNAKREKRRVELFQSFWIAMHDLQKETGLVALHLNKTETPLPVTLIDKNGIAHEIDLSKTAFALQRKATLAYSHIKSAWERGEGACAISSLIDVVKRRCEMGVFDKDPDFQTNFGFIGNEAIEIDLGRFSYNPKESERHYYRGEIYRITRQMRVWLGDNCPELVHALDDKVMAL